MCRPACRTVLRDLGPPACGLRPCLSPRSADRQAGPHQEVVALLRQDLKGDEQTVDDYIYGKNGKPKVESTGEIAKRMGISASQVSRIKNRIGAMYKKYV